MGNGNKNKSIEEKLSDAINSINVNQVKGLVEKDINVTESILKEALDQAEKRIANLKEGDKKQDQKDRLTQIIELLEAKLKNISAEAAAPPVDDSAATGSQVTPAAEPKESEEDQPDSPSLSPRSSLDSDYSKLESNNGQSGGKRAQTSSDSNGGSSSFEKIDEEPSVTLANSKDEDDQRGSQPSLPPASDDEYDGLSEASDVPNDVTNKEDIHDYNLSWLFLEEDDQSPHPVEPIPSLTSKKSEQVNNTTPQDTKSSNLHIIAASALAIVGVALGVAIAVHLEMLAVGILVGACCLVAAAVMYHYEWPSSFIETNKVKKVAPNEKKESAATSV
ncbi:MAG: hypothetical protein LBC06_00535 [Rickettsiales bacterium]|jgi:hypothetical protein|nr:hypothetical protein [Rickettsiales bacterium]